MKLNEIHNQSWKVSDKLEIDKLRAFSIQRIEQELHINILAIGYDGSTQEEAHICCSIPRYITKLSRNPSFLLRNIVISSGLPKGNNIVLQVAGVMEDGKLITIRTKRKSMKLSKSEKQRRAEVLANARKARK